MGKTQKAEPEEGYGGDHSVHLFGKGTTLEMVLRGAMERDLECPVIPFTTHEVELYREESVKPSCAIVSVNVDDDIDDIVALCAMVQGLFEDPPIPMILIGCDANEALFSKLSRQCRAPNLIRVECEEGGMSSGLPSEGKLLGLIFGAPGDIKYDLLLEAVRSTF